MPPSMSIEIMSPTGLSSQYSPAIPQSAVMSNQEGGGAMSGMFAIVFPGYADNVRRGEKEICYLEQLHQDVQSRAIDGMACSRLERSCKLLRMLINGLWSRICLPIFESSMTICIPHHAMP